jgi:two-component system sensor histidine kinase PilS (NtrC family)
MQDQREMQARMRTEKLASMGRMSAAVAHEIRNPLAAIVQANALLDEDLSDPIQKQLTDMVRQNAQRLEKIVHDVLRLTHSPSQQGRKPSQRIELNEATSRICRDWQSQSPHSNALSIELPPDPSWVWFDSEHLRRILINLLDNAQRYASGQSSSIRVSVDGSRQRVPPFKISLRIWSDGGPLEPSVEQHLFEPFFSSESRSSGLGLYICRELCDSHGATITYDRMTRTKNEQAIDGNEFCVSFKIKPVSGSINTKTKRHA